MQSILMPASSLISLSLEYTIISLEEKWYNSKST